MKPLNAAYAAVVLLGVAAMVFWPEPDPRPAPPPTVTTATADGMELTIGTDPTHVFQKAFWRRPAGDDKILQAERREWSTPDGVRKWQWFIAVSPGPELLEHLKTNPFSLATAESAVVFEKAPEWFPKPAPDFQIQQNSEGRFTLMLSADRKQLYATDSGHGFAAPVSAGGG